MGFVEDIITFFMAHARELWALFCELVCEKDQGPHGNLGVKIGLNLDFWQHNETHRPTLHSKDVKPYIIYVMFKCCIILNI